MPSLLCLANHFTSGILQSHNISSQDPFDSLAGALWKLQDLSHSKKSSKTEELGFHQPKFARKDSFWDHPRQYDALIRCPRTRCGQTSSRSSTTSTPRFCAADGKIWCRSLKPAQKNTTSWRFHHGDWSS